MIITVFEVKVAVVSKSLLEAFARFFEMEELGDRLHAGRF